MTTLQPSLVVALTAARLRDADESLSRKLDATTVQAKVRSTSPVLSRSRFNATERRVLGLVRAASDMISGPAPADVPQQSGLYPGPSRYAVLGSAGFEIPAYADMLSLTPAWRAATLRRGTPDPFLAPVQVPTANFLTAVAAAMRADGSASPERARRGEAFTLGLAAAVAHAVVAGPVARGGYARTTARPWERQQPAAQQALDLAAALRVIGGADPVQAYTGWWPEPGQTGEVLSSYLRALEATYRLESRGPEARGWPAFESSFVPGAQLDQARALAGYRRLVANLLPMSMRAWFGVLTPLLLGPGIALLLTGALPASSAFIRGTEVSERAVSELLTLADGVNSITPFIYAMIMWAGVDDQPTEPFASALWTFILRLALVGAWIPTIGDERTDPSPAGRWVSAGGMLGVDAYALIRFFASLGGRQPGPTVAFGMQILPVIMTAITAIQAGITAGTVAIAREAGAGADAAATTGWITTGVTTVAFWLIAGLTMASGLSNGAGWRSWFATDQLPSIRGGLARSAQVPFTLAPAAVFDDSALWHDRDVAAPTVADLRYPTGGRPLVKVWRGAGSPALEIAHDHHRVRIRNGAAVTDVAIGPGTRTVDQLVTALAALDHVEAAAVDAGPRYDLPFPVALADPTDSQDPRPPAADPARTAFLPLPDDPAKPYLLHHAPDAALSTGYGTSGPSTGPFDGLRGVPLPGLADADDTVLGIAADLALLLGLGAASRLRPVNPVAPDPARVPGAPAVPGPIDPVSQVFRNWNLDYRRANEWRTIVTGGAAREVAPPADPDLAEGARVAEAMGWVPLWRAWLRVAADTRSDTSAAVVFADTPTVRQADGSAFRPTNAQLTLGLRYLLDLPV